MQLTFRAIGEQLKVLCLILFTLCSTVVNAENNCEPEVSRLISAQGHVDAYLAHVSQWSSAQQGQPYCGDDKVRTGALSRAVLSMEKGIATFLALDQLTLLNFVKNAGRVMLSIETGQVHIRSHTPSRFDVTTPFVNAGIEGTEFLVKADEHSAEISVFEGKVRVFNNQGEILITKGQTAQTLAGQAPTLKQIDLKPDDAVRWALYYPPIIDFTTLNSLSNDPHIQLAQTRYESGDVLGAIDQLSLLINRQPTVELMAAQAGLFLTLGRIDSAEYLIREAEKTQPEHATLKALRAIMALTKNDKDLARQLAQSAVQSNPQSPIPYVTLSYVEQAQFNLDLALESIEKALQLAPQSGLIYCRKAELLASQSEVSLAKEAAEKALSLSPQLGRTHVILGFVELMETYTESAGQRFRQAIELDSADPLAHFGLALVTIRGGDLTTGIPQLEIAASLDPNNSLIRSYLGKAYYEQKKDNVASLQFELAKNNDPNDPTPYFYSAIQKQAQNRPIEALIDMEKAIDLNDNRAIYRSKQMLDSDLAARGAAIGRIYNEIGFGPRALVEAWTALADDPSDYSAHRLLSDTYMALPLSDMARTSELLQSQLLQPINITPLQPRQAETSPLFLGNLGPSALSFNEFNPLFERNRFSTLASGQIGSYSSYSDEVVHSGLWNDWSYSFGQFYFQTEGDEPNKIVDANIYNAFIQGRITPEFNIQSEYRYKNIEFGNLKSNFLKSEDQLLDNLNNTIKTNENHLFRLGLNWTPNINNRLLASFLSYDENFSLLNKLNRKQNNYKTNANHIELQYQHFFQYFKILIGGGLDEIKEITKNNNNNNYIYAYINYPESVKWTLGLSTNELFNYMERTYNPKLGLIYNYSYNTVLRAAVFRNVKSNWFKGESLEPTQVSGFNQVYPDEHEVPTTRYGLGLDHKFSNTFSAGIEGSVRNWETAYDGIGDWRENQYRFYFLLSPHPQWACNFELLIEDFHNNQISFYETPNNTRTAYIPLKLVYYDTSGWFFNIKATQYEQVFSNNEDHKKDNALFLDTGIGYRLPSRHGIFELLFENILDQNYSYQDISDRAVDQGKDIPTTRPFPTSFTISGRLTLAF